MRQFEDRLGKVLFTSVLAPYAPVEAGSELLPSSFKADVLVHPSRRLPLDLPGAGLLCALLRGRLGVLEPFSEAPGILELRSAQAKLPLALYLEQQGQPARSAAARGCLLLLPPGDCSAMEEVYGEAAEQLELGLVRWSGPDPVYWLRTDRIEERSDTLVFRLLARGERRVRAVREVEAQRLEPYRTALEDFQMRFKIMASKSELAQIDPKEWEEARELIEAREQVLRELGYEEGRREGLRRAALRLVARRWPALKDEAERLMPPSSTEPDLEALLDSIDQASEPDAAIRILRDWHPSLPGS